jgi:hypothetical protein
MNTESTEQGERYEGWQRKPGTNGPDDPGEAFNNNIRDIPPWPPEEQPEGKERWTGLVNEPGIRIAPVPSWTNLTGMMDNAPPEKLAFPDQQTDLFPEWHVDGLCHNSARQPGTLHSHLPDENGETARKADYWWLAPNGYWFAMCVSCVLVDLVTAMGNPDLRPVQVIPYAR